LQLALSAYLRKKSGQLSLSCPTRKIPHLPAPARALAPKKKKSLRSNKTLSLKVSQSIELVKQCLNAQRLERVSFVVSFGLDRLIQVLVRRSLIYKQGLRIICFLLNFLLNFLLLGLRCYPKACVLSRHYHGKLPLWQLEACEQVAYSLQCVLACCSARVAMLSLPAAVEPQQICCLHLHMNITDVLFALAPKYKYAC